jgi:hypothetical protein
MHMKTLLAVSAAAAVALSAAPADARPNKNKEVCTQWRHGQCVASHKVSQKAARRQARLFAMGQRVPRSYGYWTPYSQIPRTYVSQYDLNPNYRYINRGGYIYVVDPQTYAVQRVISALTR